MYQDLQDKHNQLAVIGLGYVGLPIALEFAKHFKVIGFDINEKRVQLMRDHIDPSNELESEAFDNTDINFTTDLEDLKTAQFYVVAVPTDIDKNKLPDLTPLLKASETVGNVIKKGDYVVFESTVYPGCTEDDCLPIIENISGLKRNIDFKFGYSPERINPGDKERTLTKITKVVSGSDEESLEEIANVYGHIITAGVHKASSVKVAEAAKVIENTQRDINIALMNELAMIFDRMDIDTKEVLEAAGTKWNFLNFHPGLVGGHCIGVDPYYLTFKAQKLGHIPQMILSGRKTNEDIPSFIAKRMTQFLIEKGKNPGNAKILLMGLTFKENVSDIRNSKVVDLINELKSYSINVHIADPLASATEVEEEYDLTLTKQIDNDYDAVIVAVSHKQYINLNSEYFKSIMGVDPILFDLKGIYPKDETLSYWRL